ncbi:hypothetical protein KEM55_008143 [Ascosphaera atra]|nr:hypothetical protein KEM55_008143 [Ascosphaera atra]
MATTPKSVRRQSAIPRAAGTPGGHLAAPSSGRHTAVSPTPRSGSSMSRSTTPGLYSHHPSQQPSKPRWNSSSNTNDLNVGHNFKPLSLTNPSPYRREPVPVRTRPPSTVALNYPGASSSSAVRNRSVPPPIPTPHRQKPSAPPSSSVPAPPTPSRTSRAASSLGFRTAGRLTSRFRSSSPLPPEQEPGTPSTSRFKGGAGSRMSMVGPPRGQHGNGSVLDPPPYSKLQKPNSNSALSDGSSGGSNGVPPVPRTSRSSIFSSSHSRWGGGASSKKATHHDDGQEDHAGRGKAPARPDTSLSHHSGSSKRISLLPLPRHKSAGKIDADAGKTPARPPWR